MTTFLALAADVMPQRERDGIRGLDRELSRLHCHIETAAFAPKELTEITGRDVRYWLRDMAQKDALGPGPKRKLSRATINRCQSLVSAIFAEAVDRELIETNPCLGVKSKRGVDESDTQDNWAYLTPEEQAAIAACDAIPTDARLAIRFAVGTGIRQGEQHHLELADVVVDGESPHIVVRYASRRKGQKLPPKSGKKRTVPLFGDGLAAAKEWLAMLSGYAPENPHGLMWPTEHGTHRHQGKTLGKSGTLKAYYQRAGIKLRKGLHWHALRHTCATNLVTGVLGRRWALEEVQVIMGHSSITITQRYAHVGEDAIKRAVRETVAAAPVEAPTDPVVSLVERGPEQVRAHGWRVGLFATAVRFVEKARGVIRAQA